MAWGGYLVARDGKAASGGGILMDSSGNLTASRGKSLACGGFLRACGGYLAISGLKLAFLGLYSVFSGAELLGLCRWIAFKTQELCQNLAFGPSPGPQTRNDFPANSCL